VHHDQPVGGAVVRIDEGDRRVARVCAGAEAGDERRELERGCGGSGESEEGGEQRGRRREEYGDPAPRARTDSCHLSDLLPASVAERRSGGCGTGHNGAETGGA